jgi:hypothetical protein
MIDPLRREGGYRLLKVERIPGSARPELTLESARDSHFTKSAKISRVDQTESNGRLPFLDIISTELWSRSERVFESLKRKERTRLV